ncbi:MAG TPA: hypothetical protein DCP10_08185 [Bacteroidales bacterium]|nr:hypothetical protein [Bacteroidales bacterium]
MITLLRIITRQKRMEVSSFSRSLQKVKFFDTSYRNIIYTCDDLKKSFKGLAFFLVKKQKLNFQTPSPLVKGI